MKLVLLVGTCLAIAKDLCQPDDDFSELFRKLKFHQGQANFWYRLPGAVCVKYLVLNAECHQDETLQQHESKKPINEDFSKDYKIAADQREQFKKSAESCGKLIEGIKSHFPNQSEYRVLEWIHQQ